MAKKVTKKTKVTVKAGDTKTVNGQLYRYSGTGKWFKSSNSVAANKQRALNARLDAPAVSIGGLNSQITNRDVAHQAAAAANVQYGPAEAALNTEYGQAQNQLTNTDAWYADYQQKLQANQQAVAQYQQGATDAIKSLQGGITGLGQTDNAYIQGQAATQNAVTGGVPSGQIAQDGSNALAVRQAQVGALGAIQAGIGAANNTYASNLTNVIGPAQAGAAHAQKQAQISGVLKKKTDLATEKGQFDVKTRGDIKADETKNVLAAGALNLNTAKAQAQADANTPEAKAAAADATEEAKQARKNGMTVHQWRMLGPKGRQRVLTAKQGGKGGSADNYGYTDAQWAKMTPEQRRTAKGEWDNAGKSAKPGSGKGPDWKTPEQQSEGRSRARQAEGFARHLSRGNEIAVANKNYDPSKPVSATNQPKIVLNKEGTKLTRQQAADWIRKNSGKKPLDEALIGAVLDSAYTNPPHLSPDTVRRLIAAGYKPSIVAKDLGIPTRQGLKKVKKSTVPDNAHGY